MNKSSQSESKKQWTGKSRGGYLGNLFFIYLIKLFGVRTAYAFLFLVVPYFVLFAAEARHSIWLYNRKILNNSKTKSFIELFAHFYGFAKILVDKVAIKSGLQNKYKFEFDDYQAFQTCIDEGKAVVFLSAHLGAWEIGENFFGEFAQKMHIVMYSNEAQMVKKAMQNVKHKQTVDIIDINANGLESIIKMKNVIDAGEYLCFQGDRCLRDDSFILHDFMQLETKFPKGVFDIASKFKTPVVFYWAVREKGFKYKFIFRTIDPNIQKPSKQDILDSYVSNLESVLKQYPRQWFNFYNYWNL